MVKRYFHHTFSVQYPHTMDAILYRDVNKRHCGYHLLIAHSFVTLETNLHHRSICDM